MTAATLLDALRLPREALVAKRVPKTLLMEQGAPTAADKRLLRDGIDEFTWVAALKPATGGPASFRDDLRDFLEIAVLQVSLRPEAKTDRLHALIHRAIPYPCLLISAQGSTLTLSLAPKRRSLGDANARIIDSLEIIELSGAGTADAFIPPFLAALALNARPVENLRDLYQGWIDALLALRVARLTGTFRIVPSPDTAHARRSALDELAKLTRELAAVRAAAAKEKQIARRVSLAERRAALEQQIASINCRMN